MSSIETSPIPDSTATDPTGDWWVYMILADDQSIYTGISTDPERRFEQHLSGKGARFFRGRQPLRFLYKEAGHTRSSASKREVSIKKLSRPQKLALVATQA